MIGFDFKVFYTNPANKWLQQTGMKEIKTRHDGVGKVIHWELCKRLKFDPNTKWFILKQESILENGMHKILLDFEI